MVVCWAESLSNCSRASEASAAGDGFPVTLRQLLAHHGNIARQWLLQQGEQHRLGASSRKAPTEIVMMKTQLIDPRANIELGQTLVASLSLRQCGMASANLSNQQENRMILASQPQHPQLLALCSDMVGGCRSIRMGIGRGCHKGAQKGGQTG